MTRGSAWIDADLATYLDDHSAKPDVVQQRLIEQTAALGGLAVMQIGANQGALLEVLVGGLRPRFAIEIGTFTGYSSIAIARGLPDGGRLLCCDTSEEWTTVAVNAWKEAGIADRVELKIGPAAKTLQALDPAVDVDFAFIDADKGGYIGYYEALLPRLSTHGVIAVDNTLWSGRVLDEGDISPDTVAIRAFNEHVARDDRSIAALTSIGDGLTFIRKC